MTTPKRILNFPVEWAGLAVIVLADAIWSNAIHFHLIIGVRDFVLMAATLVLMVIAQRLRAERAALVMEYFCLSLVATAAYGVFSYLAVASAYGPLWDGSFLAADRALGFDWLALYHWIMARPAFSMTLQILYVSMLVQGLIAGIVLGMRGERHDMRVLFRIIFISSFITCIGAILWPALGPFYIFHIHGRGEFLIDMQHLLSHRNMTFKLWDLTGVVSFPSFHTVVALAYAWGLRRAGVFGKVMLVVNAGMLLSLALTHLSFAAENSLVAERFARLTEKAA